MVAAGLVALGVTATPSHADVTSGNGGVLSGNQIDIPVSVPVDVSGNGASLLGTSHAASKGGAKVRKTGGGAQQTSGNHGIASGNQINAPISLPVNVCGNGAAVLGHADAGCKGGAKVEDGGSGDQATGGSGGILAGNQVNAPISLPVNVCGNAAAIAGAAVAGCEGGAKVKNGGQTGSGQETSGVLGVGSGNQANLPISIPVDICGNAVGNAAAACDGGASVRNGGHRTGRQVTNGALGVIAGNQANAPISLPINVCGNAAAIVGQAGAFCEGGSHVRSPSGGDLHTSGTAGILAGNQAHAPAKIPANVCGNAAALVGQASALCHGDHGGYGDHGGGDHGGYRTTTLPALPLLNAQPNAGDMVTLNALPGLGGTSPISALPELGVPASDARTKPNHAGALKPLKLPATADLTEVKGVPGARSAEDVIPGQGGSSPVSALPGAGDLKVVKLPATGGLTKRSTGGRVPGLGGSSPVGALPGAGDLRVVELPAAGALAGVPGAGARANSHHGPVVGVPSEGAEVVRLPVARGLDGKVPGTAGGVVVPGSPVVPSLQAVGLAEDGGIELPAGVGPVQHVSAEQAIAAEDSAGATWTFGAAALLAFMAGALGLTRRLRLGRR
ncbi:chaplin family protein [Actinomadura sp. 7K534]|uniref:chaplin family protein n=1 Tax=Actinomadura sp. 7K534 TaxID=2530366 RepID=UPI0014047ABA|nr:chaplin family protein [Actinomadura sp. 7K534]